jgi:dTDP-4-amino-4,6-dideoxygalactose transaminase
MISYACLDRQYEHEREAMLAALDRVAKSGQFTLGNLVEELEEKIANLCGTKYCITLNSGTDALIFGMICAGIRAGDKVITVPNSFIASASSIVHIGAKPVFVDIGEDQNIDVDLIENSITNNTKAIMAVHLTGRICDMDKINEIAQKYDLMVIEDAAQSFLSAYKGKRSGSFGKIGCFSAHPLKVFNACGDAGFVTTNDAQIERKLKNIRNHGLIDRSSVGEWGYVSRMDAIQASILLMRISHIQEYIEKRRNNVALYSFQTFVIQIDHRDRLQTFLKAEGIECSIHYPTPIHMQKVCGGMGYKMGDFPMTEKQANRILSVPVSQFLKSDEIEHISASINKFYADKLYED